jgi:C4-type Zn-finger protein|tara:strand:+ start:673 stop:972 length:300 start_codon:yes stop_codon:yes gene_type:complete
MFTAEVIDPEDRKRKLTCPSCGISYSARDYGFLYDNHKIVYFKYKNKIFCHECLYKIVEVEAAGEKMVFKLVTKEFEFKCVYEPEDFFDEGDIPFSDLF